jgi:hypothetical protein
MSATHRVGVVNHLLAQRICHCQCAWAVSTSLFSLRVPQRHRLPQVAANTRFSKKRQMVGLLCAPEALWPELLLDYLLSIGRRAVALGCQRSQFLRCRTPGWAQAVQCSVLLALQ